MRHFRRPTLSFLLLLGSLVSCGGGGGGGGGTGGGQTPVDPPAAVPEAPFLATLLSAAGAPGAVRVHWQLPKAGFEAALFRSTSAGTLFAGAPIQTGLTGTGTTVAGLPNGTVQFFGLGVRPTGGGVFTQSGGVLRARPGAPIYVDASAAAGGADGATPGTAFPTLAAGLNAALGGGTVWVRDGVYTGNLLPVGDGVHVYGGFSGAFSLATRDPLGANTIVRGAAGAILFDVRDSFVESAVLDGLRLDGRDSSLVGVDVDNGEVELRALTVESFTDRGVRLRSSLINQEVDCSLVACDVSRNGADGLSLLGAFDLRVDGCFFDSNVQEGIEADDLSSLPNIRATFAVNGSRFFGNGTDGIDVDLGPPLPLLLPGATNGSFEVEIRGCRFERNGLNGILIDHDFEANAGYRADVIVRECVVRANKGDGVAVDADGTGSLLLHRNLISANGGDGVMVASDTVAGATVVSNTVVTGNLGAGFRAATTNTLFELSHCILGGNFGGGVVSAGRRSTASSSVAYLQDNAWTNTLRLGTVDITDGLAGDFQRAPELWARVTGLGGSSLTVANSPMINPGDVVELGDDGAGIAVASVLDPTVELAMAPADFVAPGSLAIFAMGSTVEDWNVPGGSAASGTGMTTPGGPAVDAGVFDAPQGGDPATPDEVRAEVLYPLSVTPALSGIVGNGASLFVRFSKNLAAGTVTAPRVRAVTDAGGVLGITFSTAGDVLTINPPVGGWGAVDFRIELHVGIAAQDGTPLTTPMALAVER